MQHILGGYRLRPYARVGKGEILRHISVEMVADHEHVEVLVDGVAGVGHGGVCGGRQNVRHGCGADDVRRVPAAGALVREEDAELIGKYASLGVPLLVAFTKIDIMPKGNIPAELKKLADAGVEADIYPVSARKGTNLRKLEEGIAAMLPEGDALFSEDVVSDRSEKFMVAELMREKILLKYDQEIPHGVAVVVNTFERGENGTYEVNLDIVCEKPNHKAILIGKQGRALKEVASFARMDMEKFLGAKVFLTVYVKVREDWRDSTRFLKEFGYGEE